MINTIDSFANELANIEYYCPNLQQSLTEDQLINIVPNYDAWIAGDDPITKKVLIAGKNGQLKQIVKWGIGMDSIDHDACKELNMPIENTPGMFGEEVSDIAIGYIICLARQIHAIDRKIRNGVWFKPLGESLQKKKVALIGFGDIGRCTYRKLKSFGLDVWISDPGFTKNNGVVKCMYNEKIDIDQNANINSLENCLDNADYVICTCPLTNSTYGLINKTNILKCKQNVKIINVSRGKVVVEADIIDLLKNNFIGGVALDVFEKEPIDVTSELLTFENCMLGSHNSSNTKEAVLRTSRIAIQKILKTDQ